MLTPLTDEQLNPMRGSAPLLVERYRQLREYITAATALAHAANDSVKLARIEIEKYQKALKDLIHYVEENCGRDREGREEVLQAARDALPK